MPPGVKASDTGGPLKKGYPPPPPPGFDVTGKPIEPPEKLREQLQKQQLTPVGVVPPKTLVPQKTVRVQSAVKPGRRSGIAPKSLKPLPGERAAAAGIAPKQPQEGPPPKRSATRGFLARRDIVGP